MSSGYSISATLDIRFSESSIKNVLQKGVNRGFIYYKYILGDYNVFSEALNIDKAIKAIYETYNEEEMYCITVEAEGAYFNIIFLNISDNLVVMIPSLNPLWSRMYSNDEYDIDIERYMRVFLDMVHDYKILDLQMEYD